MFSDRVYRILLVALPRDLRRDFGADMTQAFRDRRRVLQRDGGGLARLWWLALADLAAQAAALRGRALVRAACDVAGAAGAGGGRWRMNGLWQDLRYAGRMLRRSPGVAAMAVISLALGIGANTAVFSYVNAVALRPLPVHRPAELVAIYSSDESGHDYGTAGYPDYVDFRDQNHTLTGLAAHSGLPLSLRADGATERVYGEIVSGNYFDLLGVRAVLGRTFLPGEDRTPGTHLVTVISHALWRLRFGADPSIVGKTIAVNGHPFSIIGVAPGGFAGLELGPRPQLWVPMMTASLTRPRPFDLLTMRGSRWMRMTGRLAPGVTREQVRADLGAIARRLAEKYPAWNQGYLGVAVFPAAEAQIWPAERGDVLGFLTLVMALMGAVLLLACANVAGLFLARATARGREMAIRLSLGAARRRVARQLLTESVLLAALAGAGGLVVSAWGRSLLMLLPSARAAGVTVDLPLDWRVVGFTFVLALGTGILFGLAPALHAARRDLVASLKGERATRGPHETRVRGALVVGQVGLALVLLVGAGLFVRTLERFQRVDLGFDARRLLLAAIDIRLHGYDEARGQQFWRQLLDRVAALPGVRSAALSETVPLGGGRSRQSTYPEGYEYRQGEGTEVDVYQVSTGYFATLDMPLVRGRDFGPGDRAGAQPVVIVNEAFARRFWPGEDAIGRRVFYEGPESADRGQPSVVVGVVRTAKYASLREEPRPVTFEPLAQSYSGTLTLQVRTSGDPLALAPAVQQEVRALDPNLPVFNVRSMAEHLGGAYAVPRTTAMLFGVFGVVALLLAAVGIYGVMAQNVAQRTHEIGIRLALGARGGDIVRLIVGRGMALVSAGVAIGLAGAVATTRLVRGLLFGVSTLDAVTFVAVPVLLVAVAFSAFIVPARRATRVDPLVTLRHE